MPSASQSVPLEILLEAARARVAETNLRTAAAEIGMEHSGLSKLLKGNSPHLSTVRKLTEWYLKRAAAGELEVKPEIAQAALAILVRHLPSTTRAETTQRIVAVVKNVGEGLKIEPPAWMKE